jgi:hypothetical protein
LELLSISQKAKEILFIAKGRGQKAEGRREKIDW